MGKSFVRQLEESDLTEEPWFYHECQSAAEDTDTYEGATEENTRVLSAYVGDELRLWIPFGDRCWCTVSVSKFRKMPSSGCREKLREEERHE